MKGKQKIAENKEEININFKIIIVGDSGVGKTSIVRRYMANEFVNNNSTTIVPAYAKKVLKLNGINFKIYIWDIPGQDKNPIVTRSFTLDTKGIIYCYEVNNANSKESLKSWEESLNSCMDIKIIPKIIVENKCDLLGDENHYNEDLNMLKKTSKELGCLNCFRISALNGYNVNEAFNFLINELIKNIEKEDIEINNNIKLIKQHGNKNGKCC